MDRVQIYIDGGNFYNLALKRINCHEVDFDFEKFAAFLVGDRKLVYPGKRFYIGTVRGKGDNHETTKAMSNQTKLFRSMERFGWTIKTTESSIWFGAVGYLRVNIAEAALLTVASLGGMNCRQVYYLCLC